MDRCWLSHGGWVTDARLGSVGFEAKANAEAAADSSGKSPPAGKKVKAAKECGCIELCCGCSWVTNRSGACRQQAL